jgi:CRISPR/Cas system-associated exonuclease Cas4 (RecB family)
VLLYNSRQEVNYRLSPSDLTFTYEGCKRCFYQKVVNNVTQPSIPLPSIFSQIASLLKNHYDGKPTSELHIALPSGIVSHGEKFVKSTPIQLPDHDSTCYISGRFDIVVSFDDGSYGVIDFKTSNPRSESAALYSRQLHAYAYALEHPAPGKLSLSPVTKLGLLYFYPESVNQRGIDRLSYEADVTWVEVEKDEQGFLDFLDEVMYVLELPEAPEHSPNCQWCSYIGILNNIMEK